METWSFSCEVSWKQVRGIVVPGAWESRDGLRRARPQKKWLLTQTWKDSQHISRQRMSRKAFQTEERDRAKLQEHLASKLSIEQGVCREGVWQGWDPLAWGPWVYLMITTNLFFLQLWFSHFLKYQWFAMAYWAGVDTCFLCLSSVYFYFLFSD